MFKLRNFLVVVLIACLLLTGCRTKAPQEKPQSFEGIVLNYYKFGDSSKVMESFISDYETSHLGLKINYRSFDSFEDYQKVVLNEMAEGEGPDIFSMPNTWFASNYKKIIPMPDKLGLPADFEKIFLNVASEDLVRVNPEGVRKIYGVPMTVDSLALYYNKDHFEDRLASRGEPAETWAGIEDDIGLLSKSDSSFGRLELGGLALGRADNIRYGVDLFYLMLLQRGVDFYNENLSEANFAVAKGQEVLKYLVSFADEAQKSYSWNKFLADEGSEFKELDAFVEGKVSMFAGYSDDYERIMARIDVLKSQGLDTVAPAAVRVAAMPQFEDPSSSKGKRVAYANYFAETVSRNSEYGDIAWDFLLELTKKENLAEYFKLTHKPTSRRDMLDEQRKDPIYGVFAEQAGYAESFPIVDSEKYREIFMEMITKMNDSSVAVSVGKAQDAISALLPKGGMKFEEKLVEESP